jgi:methionine-rich copper-binding protein CopC
MTAIAVALVLIPRVAMAHAVLVQSSPAVDATLQGPDVPITLKFNSRVDGSRSTLLLSMPDGQSKAADASIKQTAPDTLTAKAWSDPGQVRHPMAGAGDRWPYHPRADTLQREVK